MQVIRHGIKSIITKPRLSILSVVIIALGVIAPVLFFQIADFALLKALPFDDEDRIVLITQQAAKANEPEEGISPADFTDIKSSQQVFDSIAAYMTLSATLTGVKQPEMLTGFAVSSDLFFILGMKIIEGRRFSDLTDIKANTPVVIISNHLWVNKFQKNKEIVGESINLDGRLYVVVGVLAARVSYLQESDFILPLNQYAARLFPSRQLKMFSVIAKTKPKITLDVAKSNLTQIGNTLAKQYPETNANQPFLIHSLRTYIGRDYKDTLLMLCITTSILFLITCLNVTNLFLANSIDSQRGVGIRIALGATRLHIFLQIMCEYLIISIIGCAIGWFVSTRIVKEIIWILPPELAELYSVKFDLHTLILMTVVILVSTTIIGVIISKQSLPKNTMSLIRTGVASSFASVERRSMWRFIVVSEIALSLVLCIAAGLLINSLFRLTNVPIGFDAENILTATLDINPVAYSEESKKLALHKEIIKSLSTIPGVESVGTITYKPFGGGSSTANFSVEGQDKNNNEIRLQVVGGQYFDTLKVPVLSGRSFQSSDKNDAAKVAIINESGSRRYFPNINPIGKSFILYKNDQDPYKIIGVVGNTFQDSFEKTPEPEIYLPYEQAAWSQYDLVIKTSVLPLSILNSVRSRIWRHDPDIALSQETTMKGLLEKSITQRRLRTICFNVFASLCILLAVLGLYGLLSHYVKCRYHEFGVHLAIGATNLDILKIVMLNAGKLIGIGIIIGLAIFFIINRFLISFLFNVTSTDPITIVGACTLIIIIGLLACYVPARRASKVDPMDVLRYE